MFWDHNVLDSARLESALYRDAHSFSSVFYNTFPGVDPGLPDHERYLNQLCEDFTSQMRDMTLSGIREQRESAVSDPLYEEVAAHTLFSISKCAKFSGRLDVLSVSLIYFGEH